MKGWFFQKINNNIENPLLELSKKKFYFQKTKSEIKKEK